MRRFSLKVYMLFLCVFLLAPVFSSAQVPPGNGQGYGPGGNPDTGPDGAPGAGPGSPGFGPDNNPGKGNQQQIPIGDHAWILVVGGAGIFWHHYRKTQKLQKQQIPSE